MQKERKYIVVWAESADYPNVANISSDQENNDIKLHECVVFEKSTTYGNRTEATKFYKNKLKEPNVYFAHLGEVKLSSVINGVLVNGRNYK